MRATRTWAAGLGLGILVFALFLTLVVAFPARAELPGAPLLAGSFDQVRQGVETLAASGSPRAVPVLGALQDGHLTVSDGGQILIRGADGMTDADTGAPVADPGHVRPVRVNNAIRRALDAALGGLRLQAPDRDTRLAAAGSVYRARDVQALPMLDAALAKEQNPAVRRTMEAAHAAVVLAAPDTAEADRLAAVKILRARGTEEARSLLASLGDQPPAVAGAAAAAVAAIDRSLRLWGALQDVLYGVSLGSVLLLAAAGLAITFGVMGVINMAHGEMVMLGAYTAYVVQGAVAGYLPELRGASLILAVPLAFLVTAALGAVIERCLIRFLYGRPLETLLATFGLSLVLQQAVRSVFGPTNRSVSTPGWMSGAVQLGGVQVTLNRLAIVVFAALVFGALLLVLRATPLGLRMRAVTQNRRMASSMGIRTPWVDAATFALGSGIAGAAGVALSQIDNVSPNLGQGYIIDSFMVVVFGGVGNLWGTAVAALVLGVANKVLEPFAGAVLGKIVVLVALVLFIQRRPRGLFPQRGRAAEA
jgi:urea transport system permease protein